MPRVSVHATDESQADERADTAFHEQDEAEEEAEYRRARRARRERERNRRDAKDHVDVEIEREVTKRAIIESITRLVVVILYMGFTLVREREAGVVALDPEDDDLGPEDDWAEV